MFQPCTVWHSPVAIQCGSLQMVAGAMHAVFCTAILRRAAASKGCCSGLRAWGCSNKVAGPSELSRVVGQGEDTCFSHVCKSQIRSVLPEKAQANTSAVYQFF